MADGRHIENHFFGYNSAPYCQIKANIGMRRHNPRTRRLDDEDVKFGKSNMPDGRHFENRYSSISQPRIVRIWRNLVRRRKFWVRDGNVTKIQKFPISRWRTDAILKITTLFSKNSSLLLQWNLNACLRVKFEGVGWNESPRVRSLLVTAQLVLQVVSNVIPYACLAVSWQV